jgi:hypothetical protein
LLVVADDSEHVAGKYPGAPVGDGDYALVALYAHHIDAESLPQVAVHEPFAHKRASCAHGHECLMQVVHHKVVAAAASQLALVEVVDELVFYAVETRTQPSRQHEHGHHGYNGHKCHHGAGREIDADCVGGKHQGKQGTENAHDYRRNACRSG